MELIIKKAKILKQSSVDISVEIVFKDDKGRNWKGNFFIFKCYLSTKREEKICTRCGKASIFKGTRCNKCDNESYLPPKGFRDQGRYGSQFGA